MTNKRSLSLQIQSSGDRTLARLFIHSHTSVSLKNDFACQAYFHYNSSPCFKLSAQYCFSVVKAKRCLFFMSSILASDLSVTVNTYNHHKSRKHEHKNTQAPMHLRTQNDRERERGIRREREKKNEEIIKEQLVLCPARFFMTYCLHISFVISSSLAVTSTCPSLVRSGNGNITVSRGWHR